MHDPCIDCPGGVRDMGDPDAVDGERFALMGFACVNCGIGGAVDDHFGGMAAMTFWVLMGSVMSMSGISTPETAYPADAAMAFISCPSWPCAPTNQDFLH